MSTLNNLGEDSLRAKRSRARRTGPDGGRRFDLILSAEATAVVERMAEDGGISFTDAIESALLRRSPGAPLTRTRGRTERAVARERVRTWLEFVKASTGTRSQSDVQRATETDSYGGGSIGRFARGERSPSEGVLMRIDRVAPGSAEAYRTGPLGCEIWTALHTDDFGSLWNLAARQVPALGDLMAEGADMANIARKLEAQAEACQTLWNDSWWTRGSRTDPTPYAVASATLAVLRIARVARHPPRILDSLTRTMRSTIAQHLQGAAASIFPTWQVLERRLSA